MAHRYEDHPDNGERTWLDRPDALEQIDRRRKAGEITELQAEKLRKFHANGFVVLEKVFDEGLADEIVADIRAVYDSCKHLPVEEAKQRFENIFTHSDATRRGIETPAVLEWLDLILGMRALPYQSLTWPVSSQIGPHSDAILMTSHPRDTFIAAWHVLADVTEDCGPVYGIPGSHRWPYLSARDVGIPRGASEEECARIYAENYYPAMERIVAERGVAPYTFLGKKGDVLLWHSNLVHGAHLIERAGAERLCLIVHYYGERCEPYSDLFQRPCILPGLR